MITACYDAIIKNPPMEETVKLSIAKHGKVIIEWKGLPIVLQLPLGVRLKAVRCGVEEARIVRQNIVYVKVLTPPRDKDLN